MPPEKHTIDDQFGGDVYQRMAHQFILPSKRGVLVDGLEVELKMDLRAYVYGGEI